MRSISTLLPRAGRPRSKEIQNRREQRKQRRHTALCRFSVFSVASCWFLVLMLSVWAGVEDKAKDTPGEALTGFNNSTKEISQEKSKAHDVSQPQ